jgi:hypothetical protein
MGIMVVHPTVRMNQHNRQQCRCRLVAVRQSRELMRVL